MVLASICFATASLIIKLAAQETNAIVITFVIFLICAIGITPVILIRGARFMIPKNPILLLTRATVSVLQTLTLFISLHTIPVVDAILLRSTAPLWVPVLLMLIWHQTTRASLWLAIVPGMMGVFCILQPTVAPPAWGYAFAIVNGALFAMQSILSRQLAERGEPPVRTVSYVFFIGAILLSVPAWLLWQSPVGGFWWQALVSSALVFVSTILVLNAFRHAPAFIIAPFGYTGIVASALLEWYVFDQIPNWLTLLGILLVLSSGWLVLWLQKSSPARD